MTKIRPLTDLETNLFLRALSTAVAQAPVFITALNNLRPAVDEHCETAYVDPWARVAVGPWFFASTTSHEERMSVLLHECLHVLNNHALRAKNAEHTKHYQSNIAGDMEINSLLLLLKQEQVNLKMDNWVFPGTHEPVPFRDRLSMEEYYQLLEADEQFQQNTQNGHGPQQAGGAPSSSTGDGTPPGGTSPQPAPNGTGSTPSTGEGNSKPQGNQCGGVDNSKNTEQAFNDAGIQKSSTEELSNAQADVVFRTREAMKQRAAKNIGSGAGENFYDALIHALTPPKVNWRNLLKDAIAINRGQQIRGNTHRTFARPNRRMNGHPDKRLVFPSRVTYPPSVIVGVDTSGSMGEADNQVFLSELSGMLKSFNGRGGVPLFSVDTVIHGDPTMVRSLQGIRFAGGGGTDMAPAFAYVRSLEHQRNPNAKIQAPGLFVLATDGYVPWEPVMDELRKPHQYKSIILVTDEGGYRGVPEELHKYCTIINIGVTDRDPSTR